MWTHGHTPEVPLAQSCPARAPTAPLECLAWPVNTGKQKENHLCSHHPVHCATGAPARGCWAGTPLPLLSPTHALVLPLVWVRWMPSAPTRSSCSGVDPRCWKPRPPAQPDIHLLSSLAPSQALPLCLGARRRAGCVLPPFSTCPFGGFGFALSQHQQPLCHTGRVDSDLWGSASLTSSPCHPSCELLLLDGNQELSGENPQGAFWGPGCDRGGASALPLLCCCSSQRCCSTARLLQDMMFSWRFHPIP